MAPFVEITSATVDCAGMVHVTYETGATPALAPENEHVVMFSPASNPAAVTSHRLFQRPVNGTFTVALQSPAAEAYRVFVVADFEPANLEGVVLVDESDAPAPVDCPVADPGGLTGRFQATSAGPPAPTAARDRRTAGAAVARPA